MVAIAGLITAMVALLKVRSESRRMDAAAAKDEMDASHLVVEAATDAVELHRATADERIAFLEEKVVRLNCDVIGLNTELGKMRKTAELQSQQITVLNWHIDELLSLLCTYGVPKSALPKWAQE